MKFYLIILISLTMAIISMSGCSKPSDSDVRRGYDRLLPIVRYLDGLIEMGKPLPDSNEELGVLYKNDLGMDMPSWIYYGGMDSDRYKIYTYIKGRTSLWYVSFDDGSYPKGWWLDDESGNPLVRLHFDDSYNHE